MSPPEPARSFDARLRDNRFIVAGLIALLAALTLLYGLLQRGRGVPTSMLTNKVLLFVLWYVNVVLILVVLFILVRNVFRLIIDHRSRLLGSRFKTKLVLSAIGLSLLPVLILFPFASNLLLDSLDAWLNLPIDEVVQLGNETALALTDQIERTAMRDAERVLEQVIDLDLGDLEQTAVLQQRLIELRNDFQLDYLAVFDRTAFIRATSNPMKLSAPPDLYPGSSFLEEAIGEGRATRFENELAAEGRLILAARSAVRETAGTAPGTSDAASAPVPTEPPVTIVVIGALLPADLAEKSDNLIQAYQSYLQLEVQQDDLRATNLLLLLMVTLLVMLAFSSISLRLARRVTVPIQALAEGTRRIRSGDLDHRVEADVDDELGVLVDGFNRMTQELRRSRELVEQRNEELLTANSRVTAERLLLDAVLQNVAAGVVSIDAEGRVLTCNGAALRILHQRGTDLVGKTIIEAWADHERRKLVAPLEQVVPAGSESIHQVRLTVGGVWRTLEVKVTTLPDESGQPGGRVVVLEDLTELIHAQKMATWNEVARRIAHEIKNPLTPIKLTAERLLRKHQQRDPALGQILEDGVATVSREVDTLKNMVDEFSRFARMPRPQPREVDLEQLVGETLKLYEGLKPGVDLVQAIDGDARFARFDPEQLKSVLINLLDNALVAVEAPGSITISATRHGDQVELGVADTGQGVRAESKDKLFLPYFSTKGRGSGLGLAIVHRIVTDHHASIRVEDNHPQGTRFVLDLPVD